MGLDRTAFFTICSNNYVPYARVWADSARAVYAEVDLYICVVDEEVQEPGFYPTDCHIVFASALAIPDYNKMAFSYDIMEMNTAVKPFVFLHLLNQCKYRQVFYFDPDIQIFERLTTVESALANGASLVLTPHLCSPAEAIAAPDDLTMLRAGTYNLGFLASSDSEEARRILRWWARRLRYDCVNRQDRGLFVDQKFMDLAPGFGESVVIDRDPTLNVAYWNLLQRHLELTGDEWFVEGKPLTFFHFSGINPSVRTALSRHSIEFAGSRISVALQSLIDQYIAKLCAAGFGRTPVDYSYGRFHSGTPIHSLIRRMFHERHQSWASDPFETFETFLHSTSPDDTSHPVTVLMKFLWESYPWLQRTFDLSKEDDVIAYTRWYADHASDLGLDPRYVQPVVDRSLRTSGSAPIEPGKRGRLNRNVSVVGYLRAATGVGEVGRQTLKTLASGLMRVRGVDIPLETSGRQLDPTCEDLLEPRISGGIQVFTINADQLVGVMSRVSPSGRAPEFRIAVPFWELEEFPIELISAFDRIDEIWAATRFLQVSLFRKVRPPVIHMPIALDTTVGPDFTPADFGLPTGKFIFYNSFDFLSYEARKNPSAVVAAFNSAFGTDRNVLLLMKTMNGSSVPEKLEALLASINGAPNVRVIDRTFTRTETNGLLKLANCVVSLHRSEGLGLLVAEALAHARPTIATDYSGTTDLLSPRTGYPVGYKMVEVRAGDYPFARGAWADPDVEHAAWLMKRVYSNYQDALVRAEAGRQEIVRRHSPSTVAAAQISRLARLGYGKSLAKAWH